MKTWLPVVAIACAPLAPAAAQTTATGPLGPLDVIRPAAGPTVVRRPYRAIPLVTVRLTVPLAAADAVEAARVLQHLARPRLDNDAATDGALVDLTVEPTRATYTITGPAAGFRRYVALLRRAVGPPSVPPRELAAARDAVRRDAVAGLDTPEPLLRRRLRRALLGGDPALDIRAATGSPDALTAFWRRTYRPDRMRVIVVGAIPAQAIRDAFDGWPTPDPPAQPVTTTAVPSASTREPQAVFPWTGLAYPADDIEPARLAVAARLVRAQLRIAFLRDRRAELWWAPGGRRALVLLGTATPTDARASRSAGAADAANVAGVPDSGAALDARESTFPNGFSVARQLGDAVGRAAALVSSTAVVRARRSLRREILFAARAPRGLASVLDGFYGRTGEPDGAIRFLDAIDRVTVESVRSALAALNARRPLRAEVRP